MDDIVGKRYQINEKLAEGGMSNLYLATDPRLNRKVVIKIMNSDDPGLAKRFSDEARALGKLAHPNIASMLGYGEHQGLPYLLMEYYPGGSLAERIGRPIPYGQASAWMAQLAYALDYAHTKGIIHRDIKPENILFDSSDQPLIADFGILQWVDPSKSQGITATNISVGTCAYMAPEQLRGNEIDGRADIYALGIVYFEMLTGRQPYYASTTVGWLLQHEGEKIPKAKQFIRDLPADVDLILQKALAKKPGDRFRTMREFAIELEKLSEAAGFSIGQVDRQGGLLKHDPGTNTPLWRNPIFIAATSILLAFVVGLTILFQNTPDLPPLTVTLPIPTLGPTDTRQVVLSLTPNPIVADTPEETTPIPEITISPTLEPSVLNNENASLIVEKKRLEKISVVTLDWIDFENGLIDAGSGQNAVLNFINADTLVSTKLNLPDDRVPLSIASSQNRLYVLFNDNIKVIDLISLQEVKKFSPITGGAISLAASQDGNYLALGISNNYTQILRSSDGTVVRNLQSEYGGWAVQFSPDSNYVVSGTSRGVLRWELSTGLWKPLKGGSDKAIKSLAISKDGKLVAAGGTNLIYIWSMDTGDLLHQLTGDFGVVNSLDFSPNNQLLAAGSEDKIVYIWEPQTGIILKNLTGHSNSVVDVSFSPDGKSLASGSTGDTTIRIWALP